MNWIWNKLLTKECVVPLIGIIVILLLTIWIIKDKNQQSQEDTMTEFIEIPDDKGNVHHFHQHDLESYRDGYFCYKPQGGFYTLLTAKEIKAIVDKPTPDDALVEAVARFLDGQDLTTDYLQAIHSEELLVGVKNLVELRSALAAHKQAGE